MDNRFEEVAVPPHPSRLLEGLRDTGYTFNTAISDIVDNSIAAGADEVDITAQRNFAGEIIVKISDNGCGMSREGLISAMTYGASERNEKHSLGKFGLGLKTASTSCCKRLKVVSRPMGSTDAYCAVWDLDYIQQTDDWNLQVRKASHDEMGDLNKIAGSGSGTIVYWENVDRILSGRYRNPKTEAYNNAFQESLVALRQHLSMVYQRFLDEKDNRAENVFIRLNGQQVIAWDPFCTEYDGPLAEKCYDVDWEDSAGVQRTSPVMLRAYIVPNKSELDTDEKKQRVMPSYMNKALKGFDEESLSGFYIYRENRLLAWGEWFNMPGIDFHSKLCRFELSFNADLDDAFQVDIKKSRIQIDDELRKELLYEITRIRNEGIRRYRGNTAKSAKKQGKKIHEQSNELVQQQEPNVSRSVYSRDENGRMTVRNRFGTHRAPYEEADDPTNRLIDVVDSITDSALWVPYIAEKGKHGVQLNSSHPFYQKFYGNNKGNRGATDAMDLVFWALAEAESAAYEPSATENLEEARIETSRVLRKLSKDLPDASQEDFEN